MSCQFSQLPLHKLRENSEAAFGAALDVNEIMTFGPQAEIEITEQ